MFSNPNPNLREQRTRATVMALYLEEAGFDLGEIGATLGFSSLMAENMLYNGRHRVRVHTQKAIKDGRLSKALCENCGGPAVEAHHDSYLRLLNVRWLCRTCHRRHHGGDRVPRVWGWTQAQRNRARKVPKEEQAE